MSTGSADPDLRWCHEAVQGVSRTFALTVDTLEEPMSSQICLSYLLCRVADTIEDAGHLAPDVRVRLLDTYDEALDPTSDVSVTQFRATIDEWVPAPADRTDDWQVVARSPRVWATFMDRFESVRQDVVPPVREMVGGMAAFTERHASTGGLRLKDVRELEQYCHYAAGTVGTLVTNLLTGAETAPKRSRRLYETAEAFGLLLQLVNISKDVYDDYTAENNVYLPTEWLTAEGIDHETLLDPAYREPAARVVRRTASHARTFVRGAQTYVEAMPLTNGNTTTAWGVPFLLAIGTLRELADRPEDALTENGVKLSRQEVEAVLGAVSEADRDSIPELREAVAQRPYHRAGK